MRQRAIIALACLAALSGCYEGKMDHPLDCGMGITRWPGYCLRPGTAGYDREHPPDRVWMKPGATQDQFAQDRYACMQESRSSISRGYAVGGFNAGNGVVLPATGQSYSGETIIEPLFVACMGARGYK